MVPWAAHPCAAPAPGRFVSEYRSMLAERLLAKGGYDCEREVRTLELLKIRCVGAAGGGAGARGGGGQVRRGNSAHPGAAQDQVGTCAPTLLNLSTL